MNDYYPIVEVPPEAGDRIEQMGTKPKFWFARGDDALWLFKFNRKITGEDWSEKIATECAELLGLPHAHVELASYRDQRGVASMDFTGRGKIGALVHGNELLVHLIDPKYPSKENFRVRAHTVQRVAWILDRSWVGLPPNFVPPMGVTRGGDLFLGYLLLDALVGNTDRHHENWAVMLGSTLTVDHAAANVWVAPTYDHASCLGRELTDRERQDRLTTRDRNRTVEAYARRAKSAFYRLVSDDKPLSTTDAFAEAAQTHKAAGQAWLERLVSVNETDLLRIIGRIPKERMSPFAREFASTLLRLNRQLLLTMMEL